MVVAVGFGLSRVAHVDAASPISNPQVRVNAETQVRLKADATYAATYAGAAAQAPIDRSLIDRYCVSCHNQRLKTGDVVLETADIVPGLQTGLVDTVPLVPMYARAMQAELRQQLDQILMRRDRGRDGFAVERELDGARRRRNHRCHSSANGLPSAARSAR